MARATSGTMVSGSSIYAYVEVDGITHHSNRTTMNVRGGVTSGYYWDINCESRGKWWEGGTTHDATDWSGSQHYGGYGDLQLLSTTYTFDRYSYNRTVSAGCESWCSLGSATAWIDDITIPALPPSATTLTATRDSDNKVSLSWTNGGGVKQAVCIERQVDGGAWGEIQVVWNGSATSWADTTTSAGHSYSYRFRYYNVNAYGSYSNVETVTMTPSAPTSITTAAISGSTNVSVTLENTSAVATSLEYQVSTDGGSTWSASTTVSGSPVTSFTATGISGTALIRVRNANSTGTSSWLVSGSVTTICPPNPPTLTAPTGNVLDLAAGNVTFEWVHNALDGSAQSAAQIDYSANGGSTWTSITGITTAQSYTMAIPWSAGTTVTWRARTKGADASYSDWSAANTFNVYTAPTLSITSPSSTITGMPISMSATYSDMSGFTCQAATVSLQKDGRTLYSEPATISGTSITSSLDVSEFLPTNGESYTVVVTVRSSSSLQTSANATFFVDFTEPTYGSLQVTNDSDTGYVSLLATFDNSVLHEKNLTPFLSHDLTDSNYWGTTGSSSQAAGTQLEDGWAHFEVTSDLQLYVKTANIDLQVSSPYTLMLEVRNSTAASGTSFVTSYSMSAWETVESVSVDGDGVYLLNVSTRDTMQTRILQKITTSSFTGDIRVSLYEGDYTGEYQPYVEYAQAESISVSRINPDGTMTPLLTDGASGAGIVDKYAPLNTEYQYAVTTKAATQAVKTVHFANIIRSSKAYFYFGDDIASAKWNQSHSISYGRPEQEELRFSGRTLPVLVDDKAQSVQYSSSFTLLDRSEVDAFRRLMAHSGSVVYKSTEGDVMHAKVSVGLSRTIDTVSFYQQQLSVNYTQVDGVLL